MGCCGGRRKKAPVPVATQAPEAQLTSDLKLVKYSGDFRIKLYGSVTGTQYVFDADRSVGYVDSRDINGVLETELFQVAGSEQ